jgi:phage gp36-like protein
MRRTLSDSLVRDTVSMDERHRLVEMLRQLMDTVSSGSVQQRRAIDALLSASTEVLDRAGARFAEAVDAESRVLHAVTAQVSGSAVEVASLGEGFGLAVQLFSRASEQLLQQLARIESALGQSMIRSDEQLAYCVAQAREIIDLTLGSQKQIVEDLQHLGRAAARPAAARPAVADAA